MSNTLKSSRNFQKRTADPGFQDTLSNNTVIINTTNTTSIYHGSTGFLPNANSRQTPNGPKKLFVSKTNNAIGSNIVTKSGNPFTNASNDMKSNRINYMHQSLTTF